MKINLNGTIHSIEPGLTANQLIEKLGLSKKRFAMEVNREIVSRSEFDSYTFNDDDHVEIVQAIGGG